MIKINPYTDKLMKFPRPTRKEVQDIIKEIYNEGFKKWKRKRKFAKRKIKQYNISVSN